MNNAKFTRNNVGAAKTKSEDDVDETTKRKAKDEKNVAAEYGKDAAKKEKRNNDATAKVDNTASKKDFSTRRNLAAVHANEKAEDSEEGSSANEDPPK